MVIDITPAPTVHIAFDVLSSAGIFEISTVGEPGAHGADTAGVQGAGVKKTGGGLFVAGLLGLLHMPNGGTFAPGLKSIIVAAGILETSTVAGTTVSGTGAAPNEHCSSAPLQTH